LGKQPTGKGTYQLDGDGTLASRRVTVGAAGTGTISQDGGTIVVSPDAGNPDLASTDDSSAVGPATLAAVKAPMTAASTPVVPLGADSTGAGSFNLASGRLYFQNQGSHPALRIGVGGDGTLQLGEPGKTGEISESKLARTSLVVRARAGGKGTLLGWG